MKKKIFIVLSVVAIMLFSVISASAYIAGDTDNDFLVTSSDARFALRLSVGLEECDPESDQFKAADADGNGKVEAADARKILRVSVGLDSFPDNTQKLGNLLITKLPYRTNGLVINSATVENGYLVCSITNNTSKKDMAVAETSYIPYKLYNTKGDVIETSAVYMSQMNQGESCTEKIYLKANTGKIVFGAATVKFTEATLNLPTVQMNGLTITKAPFTSKGITVNKITLDTEKRYIYVDMTNNTGKAASAVLYFNTYDASGRSLGNISVRTGSLNAGEKVIDYTSYSKDTAKITAYELKVSDSNVFTTITTATKTLDNLVVPADVTASGLKFSVLSVTRSSYSNAPTIKIKVTNNTGKAIVGSDTSFYYKAYDANGYMTLLSSKTIAQLNNGESYVFELDLDSAAAKVVFGNLTVKTGDALNPGATSVINGITTNIASNNFKGIVVSDLTIKKYSSYTEVKVKITNKTGKPLQYAEIDYKALDSTNTVVKTNTTYVDYLNVNESTYKTLSFDTTDLSKLYFFGKTVKVSDKDIPFSASYTNVNGVQITAPATFSGIKINSYSVDEYDRITVNIKNNTGSSVSSSSYFSYRVHDANGVLLKNSTFNCESMTAGETCEVKFYLPDGAAKVTIYAVSIR